MSVTVEQISAMSPAEIDQLFRQGEVGQIPEGQADGTAIFLPGSPVEPLVVRFVRGVAWQGKVVSAPRAELKNRISPLGVKAIAADVYTGQSWFDGADCIVLDYSK